jgi:hypothetical protein
MTSSKTKQALQAALAEARSELPSAHHHLLAELQDLEVLDLLDSAAEYEMAAKFRLRVAQVLDALAQNPAPTARHVIVELTASDEFLAHDERILALLRASAFVRPPPIPLRDFWDRHSQPDDGFTPTTIAVLVKNGDASALALLEEKLADPAHSEDEKLAWMRTQMLSHRNDVALLVACRRMLEVSLPVPLRPALVEAIFDYRPDEWYLPAASFSAPRLSSASPEALVELEAVGRMVLVKLELTQAQREVVQARLEAIVDLKGRSAG